MQVGKGTVASGTDVGGQKKELKRRLQRWWPPFRIRSIRRFAPPGPLSILDVGAGNHSPSLFRTHFPDCRYVAVDHVEYNWDAEDRSALDRFVRIDLSIDDGKALDLGESFDVICLSHLIEHLPDALPIVRRLCAALKPEGIIYLEFPSVRSLNLPSAIGTLNFCDDPTHLRLYSVAEVANGLLAERIAIVRAGARNDWPRGLLQLPLILPFQLLHRLRTGYFSASGLYDLTAAADFVVGRREMRPRFSDARRR